MELTTPVMTTKGWKNHGDLDIHDYVFHHTGKPIRVLANIPQPEPCTLEVTLSNNDKLKVHKNHEWTITSHDWKGYKTLSTQDMLDVGICKGKVGKRGSRYKFQLPLTESIQFDNNDLKIDPYFLGVWLGDGAKNAPIIYEGNDDNEITDHLSTIYNISKTTTHDATNVKKHNFTKQGITEQLRKYNLLDNKHIPLDYIATSKDNRLKLLAGLIDTDGSLHKQTGQYRFINTNMMLLNDVKTLLSSLGYSYSISKASKKRNNRKIKDVQDCYQIGFTPTDKLPCKMERKQSIHKKKIRKVSITDIQQIEPVDGNCITVDSQDGLYLAGKTMQPTHNSETITDFILWLIGKAPDTKTIYTSFSGRLGVRANLKTQRVMTRKRYKKIFPNAIIPGKNNVTTSGQKIRNREMIEFENYDGSFRNTTVGGAITGETLDLGVVDDPLKGRKEANSETMRNAVWEWFTDDFLTRFSEDAGMLIILTRWHIDDPIGRLIAQDNSIKVIKYKAIAVEDEKHRAEGDPLFPEHKSLAFLLERKKIMATENWEALYQQDPVITGGNLFKTTWLKAVSRSVINDIKFERYFCTADTALKDKQKNDFTVYSAFGVFEKKLYLLDMYRGKPRSAERESIANTFHDKWNRYPFKGFYIEQKASGIDLFQRMKDNKKMAKEIERNVDKYYRAQTVEPYLEIYGLYYAADIECIGAFINEYEQFPDSPHDDTVDTVMDAFEIVYGKKTNSGLSWEQFN